MNYTEEQLREIEAKIAEEVFQHVVNPHTFEICERFYGGNGVIEEGFYPLPHYTTDLNAAFELADSVGLFINNVTEYSSDIVELMKTNAGWLVTRTVYDRLTGCTKVGRMNADAPTPALAICLAVGKLKGIDLSNIL